MRRTILFLLISVLALAAMGFAAAAPTHVRELPRVPQCFDGIDNDDDGLVDRQDPDCKSRFDNSEAPPDRANG